MKVRELREQRQALAEQRAALQAKKTQLLRERGQIKGELEGEDFSDVNKLRETKPFQRAQEVHQELQSLDTQIEGLSETEATIVGLLDESAPSQVPASDGGVKYHGWDARAMLSDNEEYAEYRKAGVFSSSQHFGSIVLGQVAEREHAMDFVTRRVGAGPLPAAPGGDISTTTASYVPPDFRGMIPPLLQPLTLLDLIPRGTTDSNTVNYVQITGLPLGAAPTAELAVKPQLGMQTADQTAPVRTIAGWIKVSRQSLDDVAGLGTFINTQIPYAVQYALLQQILAGDGSGQNILGLYNTTGINLPTFVAGSNIADAVLQAATTIVLSGAEPNFVALHPNDYQTMALTKTTAGQYVYIQPGQEMYSSPAMAPPLTMWGMPVVRSWAIPAGRPLVGDAMGCNLLIREGLNVKTSDSDQDDFVRNRVTVLGEMRAAFVVWRPAAFAIAATS